MDSSIRNTSRSSENICIDDPEVTVSMFDYSVENHLKAMDTISRLCEVTSNDDIERAVIKRLSSMIILLREWKYYNYNPRVLRFYQENGNPQGKYVGGINLPQFSSASIPKERPSGNPSTTASSKDFVFYAGGLIWALDWCPRVHPTSTCHISCEYIAVAAHPPDSSYHKIGVPLSGSGIVQIWCVLNVIKNQSEVPITKKPKRKPQQNKKINAMDNNESSVPIKPRGRPRKYPLSESPNNNESIPKRPKGRPRKNPITESPNINLDCNDELFQPLAALLPYNLSKGPNLGSDCSKYSGRKRKSSFKGMSSCNSVGESLKESPTSEPSKKLKTKGRNCQLTEIEDNGPSVVNPQINNSSERNLVDSDTMLTCKSLDRDDSAGCPIDNGGDNYIPEDVALPRFVIGLAHNGKVAWDVKWRPRAYDDTGSNYRMGYLAVILGNGCLEVWDVPLPSTVNAIFSNSPKDGTDPRFVKLKPVFKCSKVKCGDRESIPLTVEWSPSLPNDLILAGCHDGTVALWKFSASDLCEDTKPLLCFSADSVPIRTIAFAPVENDPESANVIVTAGQGSLKFWDIRDPFRPIWDLNSLQKVIYSLTWLPDPSCIIFSLDDGTLKILCLAEASYDVSVTGKPYDGSKYKGLHTYLCSSFPLWNVQASHRSGVYAYCSADGKVYLSQITAKAVEKGLSRHRSPTYLCGSLSEENSIITVNTPVQNSPIPMKKFPIGSGAAAPTTLRGFAIESKNTINDPTLASAAPKSRSRSKKNAKTDDTLVREDNEPKNMEVREKGDEKNIIETMPAKNVAMHRVRWNKNKGSERWLCYGGAAGIVRCQEIDFDDL